MIQERKNSIVVDIYKLLLFNDHPPSHDAYVICFRWNGLFASEI
jgi:hypothetical protein